MSIKNLCQMTFLSILIATLLSCSGDSEQTLEVEAIPPGSEGPFTEVQEVELEASIEDATIYYTLDGSQPSEDSSIYDEPLSIEANTTLKFYAIATVKEEEGVMPGMGDENRQIESDVVSEEYEITGTGGSIGTLPTSGTGSSGNLDNNNSNGNSNNNSSLAEDESCRDEGKYWYSDKCNDEAITCLLAEGLKRVDSENCTAISDSEAVNIEACHAISKYWYNSTCNSSAITCSLDSGLKVLDNETCQTITYTDATTTAACAAISKYWYDSSCHNVEEPINYTLTHPSHGNIAYYRSDETSMRTLTFSHDADAVTCSRDNGSTYGACDSSTTLVFTKAEYDAGTTFKIKFTQDSGPSEVVSYQPSTAYPSFAFLDCDVTVTANESFDAFEARVGSGHDNEVICIDAGVTISNSGSEDRIEFDADGITIIGNSGSKPRFYSSRDDTSSSTNSKQNNSIFYSTNKNHKFIHLEMETDGTYGYNIYLYTPSAASIDSVNYSDLQADGENATALKLYGERIVGVTYSEITTSGDDGMAVSLGHADTSVSIGNSTIETGGTDPDSTIYLTNGTAIINNSKIVHNAKYMQCIYGGGSGVTIQMLNSTCETLRYGVYATAAATITLTDSTFVRLDGGVWDTEVVKINTDSTVTGSGNTFCNAASGQSKNFTSIESGTNLGTFDDAGDSIGICTVP